MKVDSKELSADVVFEQRSSTLMHIYLTMFLCIHHVLHDFSDGRDKKIIIIFNLKHLPTGDESCIHLQKKKQRVFYKNYTNREV